MKRISYSDAVLIALETRNHPLSVKEIEREIVRLQLIDNVKTSSIKSALGRGLNEKARKGSPRGAIFEKVGINLYTINNKIVHPQLEDKYGSQKVLVFPRKELDTLGPFQGIRQAFEYYRKHLLEDRGPLFIDRKTAELSNEYKQIVSYVMVKVGNRLLRFTRHSDYINKFESFVDGNYSIGFGGHVQFEDNNMFANNDSGYENSVQRELYEEAGVNPEDIISNKVIGILNDDSTPLGEKHFAFIHLVELPENRTYSKEKGVSDITLIDFDTISLTYREFEYWSQLCLDHFFPERLKFSCFIDKQKSFSLNSNHHYLAITGGIGSGKSRVATLLANKYGYYHVKCSKILFDLLKINDYKNLSRSELQRIGYDFISSPGAHEKFAFEIFRELKSKESEKGFLIDGLRYPETHLVLENLLDQKIPVILLKSTPKVRYRNYLYREKEAEFSYEEFVQIISHPVENRVEAFLPYYKIIIHNLGSLEDMNHSLVDFFLREFFDSYLMEPWDINAEKRHRQLLSGLDLTFQELIIPLFKNKILKMKHPTSLLDVGCGTGVLTDELSEYFDSVHGVDHSCTSIEIAKRETRNKGISFHCQDIVTFSPREKFDVVVANMVFHTIKNLPDALNQIYSLMTAGGSLLFTLPHPIFYPERRMVKHIFEETDYEYEKESFHRIPFAISLDKVPLPSFTPYFHRPTRVYENAFIESGFWLTEWRIPLPNSVYNEIYLKEWDRPHVVFGEAIKPNVQKETSHRTL